MTHEATVIGHEKRPENVRKDDKKTTGVEELRGLLRNGTFEEVSRNELP